MSKRLGCHDRDAVPGRRGKRAKWTVESDDPSKELVSFASEGESQDITIPDAAYSLIWSFLLEPGQTQHSREEYKCSLDLQSISSFILVNKRAKEEFHALEGWRLVAKSLSRESLERHGQTQRMLAILADIVERARSFLARHNALDDDEDEEER